MEDKQSYHTLIINIGSLSTKVSIYRDEEVLISETVQHSSSQLAQFDTINDQLPFRRNVVERTIERSGFDRGKIDIVVARGGLTKPLPMGIYAINKKMCEDLYYYPFGAHPTNLGAMIAFDIAELLKVPAITVDTPASDEFDDLARTSGLPEIERTSAFHALNQRAAARKASNYLGKNYKEANFVVAHLGGGISVGAHKRGRVIDATHGLSEGAFTPERAGSLPTIELLNLCFLSKFSREELRKKLVGEGGLSAYLGTSDVKIIERRISEGDEHASIIYEAMAYQIAKEIGAMSTVLKGCVDAIVLTGMLANSRLLVDWIVERVEYIAPVMIYPGENEMDALNLGALGVLRREEEMMRYS